MEVASRVFQRGKTQASITSAKLEKSSILREQLRRNSSWFQFWNIPFFFGSRLFLIPYAFFYDESTNLFRLQSSNLQKIMWLIMQSTGLLVMRVRILEGWDYVKTSDEKLRYFDFGFLIVVYCFDTTFKLVMWGKLNKLVKFLNELQHSPLLVISSVKSRKVNAFTLILCVSYLIPSFFYFCLTWGIDSFSTEKFLEAVQNQAISTFSLGDSWVLSSAFPGIMVISFIINQYQASFWHFNDIYVLSSIFLMHTVAKDFALALKSEELSSEQVIGFMRSYKTVISKYNHAMGLATCVYSLYCTPYYATHLIDMLNQPDFLNRFSMAVYLGFLALGLAAAVEMNTMAKQMKRWLSGKERYLKNICIQTLSVFLDDLRNTKFGLGTFFTIHHGLAGQIVHLILTLAVITIQMKMAR